MMDVEVRERLVKCRSLLARNLICLLHTQFYADWTSPRNCYRWQREGYLFVSCYVFPKWDSKLNCKISLTSNYLQMNMRIRCPSIRRGNCDYSTHFYRWGRYTNRAVCTCNNWSWIYILSRFPKLPGTWFRIKFPFGGARAVRGMGIRWIDNPWLLPTCSPNQIPIVRLLGQSSSGDLTKDMQINVLLRTGEEFNFLFGYFGVLNICPFSHHKIFWPQLSFLHPSGNAIICKYSLHYSRASTRNQSFPLIHDLNIHEMSPTYSELFSHN